MIQMNLQNRKRLTENKLRIARGKGTVREHCLKTLLYLKWLTNKDLLRSTWNSAQCYVPVWMGSGVGGEWIHVYAWLSSPDTFTFTVHLILSQHCESAIPQYKINKNKLKT